MKTPPHDPPQRVSVEDAAPLLGVSPYTLRKWVRQRRLPFHQVGRRIVLDRTDVERFLRACRVEAREL
jgi:excisionase family DNA binding protein